jgi:ATP-dependent Lhr-like helicase
LSGPPSALIDWLQSECGLDRRGAEQAVAYVAAGRAILGAVPTQETIVAERFFDEGGGMQLVLHTPFGGRLNRAWGLALRKRFCATFDQELQAAATDEGLVLSLGERHSFPLEAVFGFLRADTVRDVLVQAILAAPMFTSRWRWNATRALALLRFAHGRRVPPQIQRMRAEDLLAAVFPAALACQDNMRGAPAETALPDHPLVRETVRDCLTEAMDVDGLMAVLRRIERGEIRCLAVDTPMPSPFCHEILNANPYAFLDDAPLEERRARAVEMRRSLPPDLAGDLGALEPAAIAEVAEAAWPVVRDADELHDALLTLIWVPEELGRDWTAFLPALIETGRATILVGGGPADAPPTPTAMLPSKRPSPGAPIAPQIAMGHGEGKGEGESVTGWVATERLATVRTVFPAAKYSPAVEGAGTKELQERDEAIRRIVQGWMESTGPTTAEELAGKLHLPVQDVNGALLRLEAEGQILRGRFRKDVGGGEWCDRRLLARIHRLTIGRLRREIEPVSAADFMQFLFQWQHVTTGARLHGEAGLLEIIRQLAGFEAAALAWERYLLPARISKYDPALLDRLCLSGSVAWGRLTPPAHAASEGATTPRRRIVPTSLSPISLFPREDAEWLLGMAGNGTASLPVSPLAEDIHRFIQTRGASFFSDIVKGTGHLPSEVEQGLWELVAAGSVTADGFDNLRALLDPRRRRAEGRDRTKRPRHALGRWSLLGVAPADAPPSPTVVGGGPAQGAPPRPIRMGGAPADAPPSPTEPIARQLLHRYGVVFRDLLQRESLPLAWRDLLVCYRKMELRGLVRGGRFVSSFIGEQFALSEAVESLRALRRATGHTEKRTAQEIRVSAADPLNLVGVILPGARVPAVPTNYVVFRDGVPIRTGTVRDPDQRDRVQAGQPDLETAESGKLYYWQREPTFTRRRRS